MGDVVAFDACEVGEFDAVCGYGVAAEVAEEGEVEVVLGVELGLGEWGIDGDAKDFCIHVVEGGEGVAEGAHLGLADAGESGGEECEDDVRAALVAEGDHLAVG